MFEENKVNESFQILIFNIGGEEYGIDIKKVQEIRGWEAVTAIPGTPDYQKGVINLRGAIVPIVDLRIKLQMAEAKFDALTTVVIVTAPNFLVGVVVDSVSDVVTMSTDEVRPVTSIEGSLTESSIKGVGMLDDRMIILLEIEEVVGSIGLLKANPVAEKATLSVIN